MAADEYARAGDTATNIQITLTDGSGQSPDLTGATVQIVFHLPTGTVTRSANVVTPTNPAVVAYLLTTADEIPGNIPFHCLVTFPGGGKQSFPDSGELILQVAPQ